MCCFPRDYYRNPVYTVASGDINGVNQNRERFTEQRTALGKVLYKAGLDAEHLGRARDLVDSTAREAGQAGKRAVHRAQQWPARTDRIVSDRDHTARPVATSANGRACRTRSDRAAQTTVAADPVTPPARYNSAAQGQEIGR